MFLKRYLCFLLFIFTVLCAPLSYSQTLTISHSGDTGTSGTNWSISGNTLTVTDNAFVHPMVIEKALDLGDLGVQVKGEKGTILIQSSILSAKSHKLKLIAKSSIQVYEPIEISGGEIYLSIRNNQTALGSICVDGKISVASARGQGGNILLEAKEITLSESVKLLVTGPTGGGNVLVGGDWQGGSSAANRVFEDPKKLMQATKVSMHSKAIIDASATENGNGGTVVLWSDIKNPTSITKAHGTIYAKGGSRSGDGGMIETSGHYLDSQNVRGSASAKNGKAGLWLFDPTNVTIGSSGSNAGTTNNGVSTITASSISSLLNDGSSVTVTTGTSGSDLGDITINTAIAKSSGSEVTLTFVAANSIVVNESITHSGGSALNLIFDADNSSTTGTTRDGGGITILEKSLSTGGGDITFGGSASGSYTGGNLYVGGGSSAISILSSGGAISVKGQLIVANSNANGLTINSSNGNISISKEIDSGNSYTAISGNRTWEEALADADNVSNSFLATITSAAENSIAIRAANYNSAWLGGRRVTGIGTNNAWRWVSEPGFTTSTAPIFFYQGATTPTTSSTSYYGGSSAPGYYNNWNGWTEGTTSGEPNNWTGSTGGALSSENESALQFTGSQGKWNDLPKSGTDLTQYIRETTLSPSKLTINSGSGSVTIGGSIGESKELASLNITSSATQVNGSWLNTSGNQTYSSGLTINNSSTTNDLTFKASGITVNGAITAYGEDITLSANISSTLSGADVLLKAAGDISLESGHGIATKGGDLTLWANSDNDGDAGAVLLRRNSTINTGSSSVAGGNLWMGGGSGTETWNDMTVGNGYATADTTIDPDNGTSNGGSDLTAAVYLENTNINTFGGHVKIKADGLDESRSFVSYGNNTIDAGSGTINIEGEISSSSSGIGIIVGVHAVRIDSELTLKSSASDTAITLNSKGVGTSEGLHISGVLTIESSGSGDVEINANPTGTGYGIEVGAYYDGILNVYAASGAIDIDSGAKGLYVLNGNSGDTEITSKLSLGQGGSISSSSSDVNIIGDVVYVNSSTNGIAVNTTGKFSLLPSSDSFSSAISWPISDFSVSNITGLTIGKTTNTSNITISSDQTVAGPISIYGGAIDVDADLVATGGNILLDGDTGAGLSTNFEGVNIAKSTEIKTVTSGDIEIIGRGSTGSNSYQGVEIGNSGSGINSKIISAGDITIIGISESTQSSSIPGVWIESTDIDASVTVTINGQRDDSYNYSYDIWVKDITIDTSDGDIIFDAQNLGYAGFGLTNTLNAGNSGDIKIFGNKHTAGTSTTLSTTGEVQLLPGHNPSGEAQNSFTMDIDLENYSFSNTVSSLTIGTTSNTSDITVSDNISISGPISIYGGAIDINADLEATGGDILLDGDTGTALSNNDVGVQINGGVSVETVTSGDINIYGRSGNNTSNGLIGIYTLGNVNPISIESAGDINMIGISESGKSNAARGTYFHTTDISAAGNISITGQAKNTGNDYDVSFQESSLTTTNGDITIKAQNLGRINFVDTDSNDPFTAGGGNDIKLFANKFGNGIGFNTSGEVSILAGYNSENSAQTSFSSDLNLNEFSFNSSISELTVGNTQNAYDITVGNNISIAGPIFIYGEDITLSNSLTASGTLLLQGSGATTQSAAVSATTLSLQGSGTFTLNDSENHVENINAGTATQTTWNISFTNKDALTIGEGSKGILSSGTIQIGTLSGNLTITETISTTNDTSSAIKLYADQGEAAGSEGQGNIIISGTPSLTTGSSGRVSLYSGKPASSTGLLNLLDASNVRTGVDSATTSFNPALSSGVYALFRTGPEITFTESFNSFAISAGIASPPQSMVISATGLTADVFLTPPTGFELSSDGSSYSDSLDLDGSSGSLANTTVYVRVKSTASGYPSGTMSVTTTGGSSKGIALQAAAKAALHFDGNNDYVELEGATFGDFNGTQNFTIKAFINPSNLTGQKVVFSKWEPGNNNSQWYLYLDNGVLKLFREVPPYSPVSSNISLTTNKWYQITAVYDGTNMKLYVNGVLEGTKESGSISRDNSLNVIIGAHYDSSGKTSFFEGKMDEVSFWNKALSQTEIESQMFETLDGNESGLLAYYNFNDGVPGQSNSGNTTLSDLAGNADGTLNNFGLGSGTTSTWVEHPFPEASLESGYTKMPVALWKEIGTNETRSSNGLTMSFPSGTSLSAANYANFASNSNTGTTTTEVPLTDKTRSQRIWYVNETGVVTATVKIGVASATGQAASDYKNPSFSLLYRAGTSGAFSQTQTGTLSGDVVTFTSEPLQDGYYALGIVEHITLTPTSTQSKTFGASDPTFTYSTSPSVSLSGVLSRTAGENVGTYSLSIGTISSTQYSITFVNEDFEITKATPVITISNISKSYGDANFTLTPTSTSTATFSFTSSDSLIASVSGATVTIKKPGTVSITISQPENQNYKTGTKTISLSIASPASTSGLITHYDFNNNNSFGSGSTAINDLTSVNNDGLLYGTSFTASTTSYLSISENNSSYVSTSVNLNPRLSPANTSAAISVFVWVYPTSNGVIVTESNTNPPGTSWHDSQIEWVNNKVVFATWGYTRGNPFISEDAPLNRWYYVGFTHTGTQMKAYVNGEQVGDTYSHSRFTPYNTSNTQLLYALGYRTATNLGSATSSSFRLGEFQVYNKTLTDAEISDNFDNTKPIYIDRVDPNVSFNDITATFGDSNINLTHSSLSSGTVSFTISDTSIASITGTNTLQILKAGTTSITLSQQSTSGYYDTTETANLVVNTKTVTVTATDTAKKNREADPTLTYTSNPTVNSSLPNSSTITFTGIITRTAGEAVGTYSITQGTLTNTNYSIVFVPGTFTISPTVPDINGFTDLTLTYGDANVVQSYTSSSTGTPTYTSTNSAVATINSSTGSITTVGVGTTTIWLSLADDGTYEPGTASMTLTVDPLAVMVIPALTQSKTYGELDTTIDYATSPNGALSNSSTITFTGTLSRTAGTDVGTYSITIGTLTNTNYTLSLTDTDYTINRRPITISAATKTKVYGATDPSLTHAISSGSVISGDNVSGVLTRTAGETAGTYTITQNTLTYGDNYDETYEAEYLTITNATVTLTVSDYTKVYDNQFIASSNLSFTAAGLVNGDTIADLGTPVYTISGTATNTVGTYSITLSGLSHDSYNIVYVGGNASITPATLTITADTLSKTYGDRDPELTHTTIGLISGDTSTGTLTRTAGENVGNYTISNDNLTYGNNYTEVFETGTLTITTKAVTVTANAQTKNFGDADPSFTFASIPLEGSSLTNGDTIAFTGTLSRTAGENAGTYSITIGTLTNTNYSISYTSNDLTINKIAPTLTFNDISLVYGDSDVDLAESLTSSVTIVSPTDNDGTATWFTNGHYNSTSSGFGDPWYQPWLDAPVSWAAKVANGRDYYIGLDLGETELVSGIITQGKGSGSNHQWIKKAKIEYSTDGVNYTVAYANVNLNTDGNTKVTTDFDSPITLRYIRLWSTGDNQNHASVRMGAKIIKERGTGAFTGSNSSVGTISGTSFINENVGSTVITYTQDSSTNYLSATTSFTLTVNPLDIALTPTDGLSKVYGDTDPSLTYTTVPSGSLSNSATVTFTGALTRTAGEVVAAYPIGIGTLTNTNYNITYTSKDFEITSRTITVTAAANSKVYGDSEPILTYTSTPAIGDPVVTGSSKTVSFTGTITRTAGEEAGTYSITLGTLTNTNYNIDFVGADLSITPKSLTVTGVTAADKQYNGTTTATVSTSTMSYTGVIDGDTLSITPTGSFDTFEVGNDKTVNLSYSLSGAESGNYTTTGQVTTTASILANDNVLDFDGSNDYLLLPGGVSSNLSSSNFTIEGYVKVTVYDDSNRQFFFVARHGSANDRCIFYIESGTPTIKVFLSQGGSSNFVGESDEISINEWYHYALVKDGPSSFKFYVNGALVSSGITPGAGTAIDVNQNPVMGSDYSPSPTSRSSYFNGQLDEFRLWTEARSLAEIQDNINKKMTGSENNLDVYYSFDQGVAGANNSVISSVLDGAGTAHATMNGFAKSGTSSNFVANTRSDIKVPPTLTLTSTTKVYGDADFALSVSSTSTGTITYTTSDSNVASIDAATGSITITGVGTTTITATQTDTAKYTSATATATVYVAPKPISFTGVTASDKVYDGTTTAATATDTLIFSGLVGSDEVLVSPTGSFDNANVGVSKTVSLTYTYSGSERARYTITGQATTTASITTKSITIIPTAAQSKTYGLADATLSYTISPSTLPDGTAISLGGTLSRTTGENVGTYSITIGTVSDTNYNITLSPETFAINKKTITVSGITAEDKVYDGTTTSTLDLTGITFVGKEAGDTITATVTGTFDSKNIGTGKTVTLTASYSSTALDNYTIVDQTSTTASITARTISATLIGAVDKIYNATTSATLTANNYQLSGFVAGESATITQTFGTYDTKDIGSSKEVSVSLTDAYAPASGTLLSNYSLAATASGTVGNITAKTLTVTHITVLDKVYDGSTNSSVNSSTIVYNGLESGDDVSINSTSGVFDNEHVGVGKTLTLTNTYTGTDLNNYTLVDQATATASITAKTVSVSLIGSVTKIYNGTISASLNPSNFQVSGVISGESIGVSATQGTYDTKEIGTSKMVTVALTDHYLPDSGTLLSNYALAATATGTVGTITAQTLTVTGIVVLDKVYDGTVSSTVITNTIDYEGLAPGDNVYINTSSGLFTDANVGLGKTVNLTNTYAGTDLANYTIVNQTTTTASITAKPITIIPTAAQSKTYGSADATLSYTISPSTLPDGTAISLGGTLSRTTGENVGTYSITIGTVSDTNYEITLSPETFAINKKTITVSGITAGDKVYDGTTTSTLDLSSINFDSLSFSDAISATVTGTFDTKNIGTGKTVTLTASYSSTALDNYTIVDQTTTTASITAKPVYVSGDTGIDKTFDNTTNLPLGEIGYGALTGVLSGEDVSLTGVGVYDAATAGSRVVQIGTVTLTGADKDNYSLNWTNGSGTISKKTLTVTANNDAKFVTESDTSGYNGVSYTGFEGDDDLSDINISGLSISRTNSTTNTAADSYPGTLVPAGVTATNYSISYVNGDYTIIPADKLLLKVSNQTTTYGTAATYSITSAQYYKTGTGLVNLSVPTPSAGVYPINDGASTINIEIVPDSPVNSSAGKLTVGSYGLTANVVSGSSGNFSNNIEVIGNHSVAKQSLTASASSVSKEYDATTAMAGVRLSLATLETADVVTVNGTGSFSSPNVGTGLGYTISGLSLFGTDANNYYLSAGASFSGSNGVITRAPLSITANNDNGVDTAPAYSGGNGVTYSGFKGTDTLSNLGGTLSYTGTSQGATAAGTYAIEPTGITSSNYSITFVAGTLTIIVGDSDGDGVRDPSDNCPTTANPDQADTDGDGIGDVCDNAPNIPNPDQKDTDGDGIGDVADTDDDNDGCPDTSDAFPLDPSECSDNDGDGIGDNADPDDDNDTILDSIDNCPTTPNTDQKDTDADGTGDVCDNDTDNDGMTDEQEAACGTDPLDATDTPVDTDADGIPDCIDTDKDNDGYQDISDAFPLDKDEHLDTDADGIGNNADTDDDNDGQSDEEEVFCGTDPLDATSFSGDVDNDGITDCRDQDNDNDGVNDAQDAFPLDPSEWTDTDADGIGNNADQDDDNDGYSDLDELECNSDPLNNEDLPADLDQDGMPDCKDTDIDGDGCLNTQDVFPRDPSECIDTDGDGLGDNVDVDDDNDGVIDGDDAFPLDPSESKDADNDGIGDNADLDDNNDGFDDEKVVVSGLLTPNSSGMENTWKIVNIDQYPQARVAVYDKNGLEVFSAKNYQNDWKGTYQKTNTPLPAGSYLYRINLGDGSPAKEGWIFIQY